MSKFRRAAAALLLVAGCQRRVAVADLPGLYVLNGRSGFDSLRLESDGTYLHTYQPFGDAGAVHDSGSWSADTTNGGTLRLHLENFVVLSQPDPQRFLPKRGLWILELDKASRGVPRIPVESDLGLFFDKR